MLKITDRQLAWINSHAGISAERKGDTVKIESPYFNTITKKEGVDASYVSTFEQARAHLGY